MEVTEQENGRGSVGRSRHLTISRRDTLKNDLKNSTPEGCLSLASAVISVLITGLALYYSYRKGGNAGYEVGILCFGGLLMAVMAVLFGFLGKRNRNKIRHEMEKRGIAFGILIILLLIALFVRGAILFGT